MLRERHHAVEREQEPVKEQAYEVVYPLVEHETPQKLAEEATFCFARPQRHI